MGKTSSAVKNRWNDKNYDYFRVTAPKGTKDNVKNPLSADRRLKWESPWRVLMKEACARLGVSMNSVFTDAMNRFLEENKE